MAMVVISPVVNAAEETMAPENLYEAHTLDFADGDEMATLPYRLLRPAVIRVAPPPGQCRFTGP